MRGGSGGLEDCPARVMSGKGSTGSSTGCPAPLAVFVQHGLKGFGSSARSAQKRQRFCERDCLAFTCEWLKIIFAKASKNFHEAG
jgi:hypothetical protein